MENKKAAPVCETGAASKKEMYAPVKVPESMTVEDALEFLGIMCFLQEYDYEAPTAYRYSYTKLRERVTQTLRTAFSENKAAPPADDRNPVQDRGQMLDALCADILRQMKAAHMTCSEVEEAVDTICGMVKNRALI